MYLAIVNGAFGSSLDKNRNSGLQNTVRLEEQGRDGALIRAGSDGDRKDRGVPPRNLPTHRGADAATQALRDLLGREKNVNTAATTTLFSCDNAPREDPVKLCNIPTSFCNNLTIGENVSRTCPIMCGRCPLPSSSCDASGYSQDLLEPLSQDTMELDTSNSCQAKPASCIPPDRWHWARGKGALAKANKDRTYCGAMCGIALCCPGQTFTARDLVVIRPGIEAPAGIDAEIEVTFVTAGSFSRIEAVRNTLQRWRGPMVIVFHIHNATVGDHAGAARMVLSIVAEFRDARANIKVVCYITKRRTPQDQAEITALQAAIDGDPAYTGEQRRAVDNVEELSTRYPINTMRNVAVDQAATNWVLPLDMDLVPSETLYDALTTNHLVQAASIYLPVLIVPHFEMLQCKAEHEAHANGGGNAYTVPKSMAELVDALRFARSRPFHLWGRHTPYFFSNLEAGLRNWGLPKHLEEMDCGDEDKWYLEGHGNNLRGIQRTKYEQWISRSMLNFTGMYAINNGNGFPETHYEPFVAVRRVEANGRLTPRFSEYFVGRNMNKVSWVAQLYRRNFHFFVVLQDFLNHYPHGKKKEDHKKAGSANEAHSHMTQKYFTEIDRKLAGKNAKRPWSRPSTRSSAHMAAVTLWCPAADQELPPAFVRMTPLCPEPYPFLDRAHTYFVEHGDVCRVDPEHTDYWECPDGCKKSATPPYCYPEPGSDAFPERIEGAEGNLRPCRIPKATASWTRPVAGGVL